MQKSNQQWREELTEEQYRVTREGGTETPFSGELYHNEEDGMYHCVCCGAALFSSDAKFDSGSGWPSFDRSMGEETIKYIDDDSHGMQRTEVRCAQCDAHLGHVFPDGPEDTTGQRYCINSVALEFEPKE